MQLFLNRVNNISINISLIRSISSSNFSQLKKDKILDNVIPRRVKIESGNMVSRQDINFLSRDRLKLVNA